jgi:phage nucleotide-binding protein
MSVAITKDTVLVPPKLADLGKFHLMRASDVGQSFGLNLLIYGQSGTGKTTLAASAQDSPFGADVLFLDLEGGTLSLGDRPDIAVYRPESLDEMTRIVTTLAIEKHTFKTVVVDSLTEAQTLSIESVTGRGKAENITQPGYRIVNDRLDAVVRLMRELTQKRKINTIFTSLSKEQETPKDSGFYRTEPGMTPGAVNKICATVDMVALLRFDPKTDKRTLYFEGTSKFIAKVRQPVTAKRIPKFIENPTMATIFAAMRGEGSVM